MLVSKGLEKLLGQWNWKRLPHPIEAVLTWAHSGRNE